MAHEIHLKPGGNDRGPGTAGEPLATLLVARDRLRALRHAGTLPEGGAVVTFHAGTYRQTETFRLEAEDSGTVEAPVVFRAAPGEIVTVSGGMELPPEALQPVTDPAVLARLPEAARQHVHGADVGSVSAVPCAAEVTCNEIPLTLARWPNAGYVRLAGPPAVTNPDGTPRAAKLEDGFLYHGDRPRGWREPGEVWTHIWGNEFATCRAQVARIDLDRRHVLNLPPHGSYGFPPNGRFFWFNILEEIDEPGEYYLDRKAGRLYVWPPETDKAPRISVALLDQPLVELHGASHVRFEGLAFRHGRGDGVVVRGGSDVTVAGCLVADFGGVGIVVEGGLRHAVRGCEVRHTGGTGIALSGGDRRTLEPCGHVAENNHVHHFALWHYCYQPGIGVFGGSYQSLLGSVGIRIANNRIHDCPHNGILYYGNDLEIEGNEIYRVVMDSADSGAIYTDRDFARRGTTLRHNRLHHCGRGFPPCYTMGIYFDGFLGGDRIVGNVLEGFINGVWLGGGTDVDCENNLFIDCDPAISVMDNGNKPDPVYDEMKGRFYEVNAHQPPYSTRYPELAKFHAHFETGERVIPPPEGTRIRRNIAAGAGDFWGYGSACISPKYLLAENNLTNLPESEVDLERGGLVASQSAKERAIGFEPIPMERIGLVRDAARPAMPPRSLVEYRIVEETPWQWTDGVTASPVVRVEVANAGATRECGVAELFVSPEEDATLCGPSRLRFDLAPGESARSEPVLLKPVAVRGRIEVGIRRLGTVDQPSWHQLCLQSEYHAMPLAPMTDGESLRRAVTAVAPLRTPFWDGRHGEIRLALTPDALAVEFDLRDSEIAPKRRGDPDWWASSCIEIFARGPASPYYEQIGLLPAGDRAPVQAMWLHDGILQPEAPGLRVAYETTTRGYRLPAVIPFSLLGWDLRKGPSRLEISICARPNADSPRTWTRIFGVEAWMKERHRFAAIH